MLASGARRVVFSHASVAARAGSGIAMSKYGDPSTVLRFANLEPKSPGKDEVKVRVQAAPVHSFDVDVVRGTHGRLARMPEFGGSEFVGEVVETGPGVSDLAVGDRVAAAHIGLGTWRSELTCPSSALRKMDRAVPLEYAAASSVCLPTAVAMLRSFVDLKEGDVIAQNLASSSVGQFVIQLAAAIGVSTINIISSPRVDDAESRERLKALGASVVVDSDYADSSAMSELLQGVSTPILGLNGAGGKDALSLARLLGKGSNMVTYANASRTRFTLPDELGLTHSEFNYEKFAASISAEQKKQLHHVCDTLLADGSIHMHIERHPFGPNFLESMERARQRFVGRKVLFTME